MKSPLKRIEELIPALPEKDAKICSDYLSKRNFEAVLEIVRSDIYKARRKGSDDLPDDYMSSLIELESELIDYMSILEVPDNSDDYDYY